MELLFQFLRGTIGRVDAAISFWNINLWVLKKEGEEEFRVKEEVR